MSGTDVLLLVPFEDASGVVLDPNARRVLGSRFFGPVMSAFFEFQARAGLPLALNDRSHPPLFGGAPFEVPSHRSLSAVTLSTHLERAGLRWRTLDPGAKDLGYWRRSLRGLADLSPAVVGVSTTFLVSAPWIAALLSLVRASFPRAQVVLGGYYYASDARAFLSFDADVFCVGEGELRFPELVRAIQAGRPLDAIPGLYLPQPGGGLRYTGRAEPLNLSALPAPDWSLSARIDPPVDIEHERLELGLETQRGCAFKCGFCTYRTLLSPNLMTPELAAERIVALAGVRSAAINIVDATATYPHERWQALLRRLIELGGSPHPLWCYARVSDISEETAQLMALAGVKQVFIGQESGEQKILNAMRKGTNVRAVAPAIAALARHDISVMLAMIHGYPGEDLQTVEATRRMLLTANDGHPAERLPALIYLIAPFAMSDMAGVASDERVDLVRDDHYIRYRSGGFSSETWAEQCARTLLATSRVEHAPVNFLFFFKDGIETHGIAVGAHPQRQRIFEWLKLVERGTGLLLAQQLEGTTCSQRDIDAVRRRLESFYDPGAARRRLVALQSWAGKVALTRLVREWSAEGAQGVGPATRLAAAALAFNAAGRPRSAVEAYRAATLVHDKAQHVRGADVDASLAEMAKISIDEGLENGRTQPKMRDTSGQLISLRKQPASQL